MKVSMVDGLNGFRFRAKRLEFMNDLYGYKTLAKAVYVQLYLREVRFRKSVSPASFYYFCDLALWRRLFFIRYSQDDDDTNVFLQVDKGQTGH